MPTIGLAGDDLSSPTFLRAIFLEKANGTHPHTVQFAQKSWHTKVTLAEVEKLFGQKFEIEVSYFSEWYDQYTGEIPGAFFRVVRYHKRDELEVEILTTNGLSPDAILDKLDKIIPIYNPEKTVPINFWSWDGHSASYRRRTIDWVLWDKINANYPRNTRDALAKVINWERGAGQSGKLVLLHGEPGTGKTYSIRSLAYEWNEWCDVHYIADPENFFGIADYMLTVLLNADDPDDDEQKWRLIIVEDADELIRVDGHEKTGQSMSRLLNLCDGLIGQGLKVLTLITTNEHIEKLHPAIVRSGRCAANVEAKRFPRGEAEGWLLARIELEHLLEIEAFLKKNDKPTLSDMWAFVRTIKGEEYRVENEHEELSTVGFR